MYKYIYVYIYIYIYGVSGTGVRQSHARLERPGRLCHQARLGPDHGSVNWIVQVSAMIDSMVR